MQGVQSRTERFQRVGVRWDDEKDPAGTFPDGTGVRNASVDGDTRFDIELLRR
jgi:hypothetical protein